MSDIIPKPFLFLKRYLMLCLTSTVSQQWCWTLMFVAVIAIEQTVNCFWTRRKHGNYLCRIGKWTHGLMWCVRFRPPINLFPCRKCGKYTETSAVRGYPSCLDCLLRPYVAVGATGCRISVITRFHTRRSMAVFLASSMLSLRFLTS